MKRIICDYFMAYRAGRWKTAGINSATLMIYCLAVFPCLSRLYEKGALVIGTFYVTAVIILYTPYAAQLHPVTLPKLMHLCPMDVAERHAYLAGAYAFKVLFPVGIAALSMGLLTVLWDVSVWYGACVVLAVAGEAVCTSLFRAERIAACTIKKQSAAFYGGADGWETCAMIVADFMGLFLIIISMWADEFDGYLKWAVLVPMAVLELPITAKMLRRVPEALNAAVYFEG